MLISFKIAVNSQFRELPVEVLESRRAIHSQVHLVAQVAFFIEPILSLEGGGLLALGGGASLEVLCFKDHSVAIVSALLDFLQGKGVRKTSFHFPFALGVSWSIDLDEAVLCMEGRATLCVLGVLLNGEDDGGLGSQEGESERFLIGDWLLEDGALPGP